MLNRLLKGLGGALSLSAVLLAACSLLPPALSAEVPVKFTYQGNLRQNGFLVNGQRSMVFRVYDSSSSVSELWTSPAYDVSLSTGVFRVTLEPAISDWQSGNLWLELEIEGNRMAPREELTSSPYSVNSLMLSGKRYTTAAAPPSGLAPGDLWFDSVAKVVSFWDGVSWVSTSGSGAPGPHAATHAGGGTDPVTALGTHTVTGYITVSSSVSAGWFAGNGAGLYSLDASNIATGVIGGDRIAPAVLVSTHIADRGVDRTKLSNSGCGNGQVLKWDNTAVNWICADDNFGAGGGETDPLSIHNQDMLQSGTTFYVSSGTVNDLNVNNSLKVTGTAQIKGGPGQSGLAVEATGNVGIGVAGASARLEVRGADTQNYSLAVGTGTFHQVVVSTSGAVGIGTETPRAKVEVSGGEGSGEYIMIFNSGEKMAAWLRNK